MSFQIADKKEIRLSLSLALFMGAILTAGYQPACNLWMSYVLKMVPCTANDSCEIWRKSAFPLFACFFYFSLPRPSFMPHCPISSKRLAWMSLLPVLIAFGFGSFKIIPLSPRSLSSFPWEDLYWTWIATPLGEEWLFRGWLTTVLIRLGKTRLAGPSPLLPLWLWGTASAFSLWHLQNFSTSSWGQVLLQVVFTFFAGVWLGLIRWNTGKIWPCMAAHFLINFAADWKLWFVLS